MFYGAVCSKLFAFSIILFSLCGLADAQVNCQRGNTSAPGYTPTPRGLKDYDCRFNNAYYFRKMNPDWIDQVIALNNAVPNDIKFAVITVLPMVNGVKSNGWPVLVKMTLLHWQGSYSSPAALWTLPANRPYNMNAVFLDMCPTYDYSNPNHLLTCDPVNARKMVSSLMHGSWTRGQTWTPFRSAVAGNGAYRTDKSFFEATAKIIMSFLGVTWGFDANNNFIKEQENEYATFIRVDDDLYAFQETVVSVFHLLRGNGRILYGVGCGVGNEDLGGLPVAGGKFKVKYLKMDSFELPLGIRYHYNPNQAAAVPGARDLIFKWRKDIAAIWRDKAKYMYSAFDIQSTQDNPDCPAFDFLSFSFPWLMGRGIMWMGREPDMTFYTNTYKPQVAQGVYAKAVVFDAFYFLSGERRSTMWNTFKGWYDGIMLPLANQMEPWLASSMTAAVMATPDDVAMLMLDAVWSLLLTTNHVYNEFGENYTIKNMLDYAATYTFPKFDGMTGEVLVTGSSFLTFRDRGRPWYVHHYERAAADYGKPKRTCDFLKLNDGANRGGWDSDWAESMDYYTICMEGQETLSTVPSTVVPPRGQGEKQVSLFVPGQLCGQRLLEGCQDGYTSPCQNQYRLKDDFFNCTWPNYEYFYGNSIYPRQKANGLLASETQNDRALAVNWGFATNINYSLDTFQVAHNANSETLLLRLQLDTFVSTCVAGEYFDHTNNRCEPCERGRSSAAGAQVKTCTRCQPGTFAENTGQPECVPCQAGKFEPNQESWACTNCSLGQFQTDSGQNDCKQCIAGQYADRMGQSACTLCDLGTYQGGIGSQSCTRCPLTFVTKEYGSSNIEDCKCGEGSFNLSDTATLRNSGGTCNDCTTQYQYPDTVFCAGFGVTPRVEMGYMSEAGSTTIYSCAKFDAACPGGPLMSLTCADPSASGIACAWCGDMLWNPKDGMCTECTDYANALVLCILVVITLGLFIKLRPAELVYSETTVLNNLKVCFMTVPIAHFTDFMQINTIYARSGIKWPSSGASVFGGVGSVFDLEAFQVPCLTKRGKIDSDAIGQVLLMNVAPGILITIIFLLCIPHVVSAQARAKRFPHPIGAINTTFTVMIVFFITILNFSINLVLVSYTHPKDAGSSLTAFPYILTASDQKNAMTIIAGVSLCVWCAGTLVVITTLLYVRPFRQNNLFFQRSTLALVLKYKTDRPWWVIIELLTKCFVCLSLVMSELASKQMQILAGIFVVYGAMLVNAVPYRYLRHFYSDVTLTICKVMIPCMAVSTIAGDSSDSAPVLTVILVAYINCFFVVVHSLWSFFKGYASSPQYDVNLKDQIFTKLKAILMLPVQNPITDLVPGLDEDEGRWSQRASNTDGDVASKMKTLEANIAALKATLADKQKASTEDAQWVGSNLVPKDKMDDYNAFTKSVRDMCEAVRNKSGGDSAKKHMEQQSQLIQKLLAESEDQGQNDSA